MIHSLALAFLVVQSVPQEQNHARIFGRFVDDQGQAIAGASVLNRVWPGAEFPALTDPDGRFEALVVWPADHRDTWHECITRALGFQRWEMRGGLVPNQELDLGVMRLAPGGAVSGQVRLGSMPAADAEILVVTSERLPPEPARRLEKGAPTGPAFWLSGGPNPEYEAPIDRGTAAKDGLFCIIGLAPGRYGLWVRCDASYWATTEIFEVQAAEETVLPDLVLEPLPPEHWIEGQVIDPDGVPVSGARVEATSVKRNVGCFGSETGTGPDGRFRLYVFPLACGPVALAAKADDERFSQAELTPVEPGRRDVLLELGRMLAVELQVFDAAGRPLDDFTCRQALEFADRLVLTGSHYPTVLAGGWRSGFPNKPARRSRLRPAATRIRRSRSIPLCPRDRSSWSAPEPTRCWRSLES